MARWLQSGTRRDVCALLCEAGELRAQQLKSRLESHYDTRIEPRQFYGALDRLVSGGHVEKRTDGIHDVYSLTTAGERALRDHYEWFTERVEGSHAGDEGDESETNGT
jgi:DNA-binding PadR family transcriptional regulator